MNLKEKFEDAAVEGAAKAVRKSLNKIDAALESFAEMLDVRVERALQETKRGAFGIAHEVLKQAMGCNEHDDARLSDMIPFIGKIEALPSYKKLMSLCAAPERDVCCTVHLFEGKASVLMLSIGIDPARSAAGSGLAVADGAGTIERRASLFPGRSGAC